MAVVVVTQKEWDQLWLDLKPPFRKFSEVSGIDLGEDVVVVGLGETPSLSLQQAREKHADKLGGNEGY